MNLNLNFLHYFNNDWHFEIETNDRSISTFYTMALWRCARNCNITAPSPIVPSRPTINIWWRPMPTGDAFYIACPNMRLLPKRINGASTLLKSIASRGVRIRRWWPLEAWTLPLSFGALRNPTNTSSSRMPILKVKSLVWPGWITARLFLSAKIVTLVSGT